MGWAVQHEPYLPWRFSCNMIKNHNSWIKLIQWPNIQVSALNTQHNLPYGSNLYLTLTLSALNLHCCSALNTVYLALPCKLADSLFATSLLHGHLPSKDKLRFIYACISEHLELYPMRNTNSTTQISCWINAWIILFTHPHTIFKGCEMPTHFQIIWYVIIMQQTNTML